MAVAILGLAAYAKNTVWQNVELLARSVRNRSPRTPLLLLTAPLGSGDRALFERFGIEAIECVDPPPGPGNDRKTAVARRRAWILELYGRRHALYRQVIQSRGESHFLLTDTRDVIVTAPLDGLAAESRLVLSQEHKNTSIAADHWNRGWILEGYGAEGLATVGAKPILCAGTVFGPRELIDAYLAEMSREVERIGAETTRRIGDQPLHNHLAYSGKLPHYEISTAEDGWMRAVGVMPFAEIQIDWDEPARAKAEYPTCAIVHQYDRHLESPRMRSSVARVAALPWWHGWRFDAFVQHGGGVVPRVLRPIVRIVRAIKRRLLPQRAS